MKKLALILLVLLAALLALPLLIPTDSYLRQIERFASGKINAPVHIDSLRLALLPSPRATLSGIAIGENSEIRVKSVTAVLDTTTLFRPVKVVSLVSIDSPILMQQALPLLGGIGRDDSGTEASVALRRIQAHRAKLEGTPLPAFDADIGMSESGKLLKARISTEDGKLAIDAEPSNRGLTAKINAKQWTPPAGPPLLFDKLAATLDYSGKTIVIRQIDASLYRGKLAATLKLDWKKNWALSGTLRTEAIELSDAARIFTHTAKVSGRLSGAGEYSASAAEAGQLAEHLAIDFRFNVSNGALHGVDLLKAASILSKQGPGGGETRFDEFSGELHSRGKAIELSKMQISSGLLAASGNVKISADRKLSGRVDAELKKGISLVSVPLEISGTLDQPQAFPTRAAMAGAITGTALFGPGIGTSLGLKAGKLFGR